MMLLTSGHIGEEWYYLDWTSYSDYKEYIDSQLNLSLMADYMSNAYEGEFLMIPKDDFDGTIEVKTKGLEKYKTLADLGIKAEDLGKSSFDLNLSNQEYKAYVIANTDPLQQTTIYLDHIDDESDTGTHRIITMMGFSICFLAVIITFCYSVLWDIKGIKPDETEAYKYTPARMKHKTALLCAAAGLLLLAIGVFSSIVQEFHHENRKGNYILNSLEVQLEGLQQNAAAAEEVEIAWYEYFGHKISAELTRDPGLLTKEKLGEIAGIISSGLIMVFDDQGNEIACSSDYIGYSLFDEEYAEAAAPFKNLLKGVPSYIRTPGPDVISGREMYVIGVRYSIPDTGKYGALLLFADPYLLHQTRVSGSIDSVYSNLATDEEVILNADPETRKILSISNKKLQNAKITGLNPDSNETDTSQNALGFFSLDDAFYYGIAKQISGKLYYYGEDITDVVRMIMIYSLSVSLIFITGCLLLSAHALKGYTREYFEQHALSQPEEAADGDNVAEKESESPYILPGS